MTSAQAEPPVRDQREQGEDNQRVDDEAPAILAGGRRDPPTRSKAPVFKVSLLITIRSDVEKGYMMAWR